MLFNTWTFLAFAVVVFGLYYVLPFRWQNRMLLVASYVFYGAWDWRFLSLILFSTLVDFLVGRRLGQEADAGRRRQWLVLSCVTNLGLLGVFKYLGFFAQSFADLAHLFGWNVGPVTLHIVLPVGISFYTFQTMSYTIDVYRRKLEPVESFQDFALFVAYFPQLVAGPIERASHLLPQLMQPRRIRRDQFFEGSWLIAWGLFKKAVVADNIAPRIDEVFLPGNDWATGGACLVAIYGFAIQIYCDFSGYSDVARGLGKLMGIDIMRNFQIPYIATNPSEFWRRWHISLSTWLRDYLYVPLGGNRGSKLQTYRNLLVTMILGGLWHGAAWTFVLWGVYQGVLLIGHRWFVLDRKWFRRPESRPLSMIERFSSWFLMFHLVCLGWLIFRAKSVEQIGNILRRIVSDFRIDLDEVHILWPVLFFGGILLAYDAWLRNADDPRTRPGWKLLGPIAVTVLAILALVFWPPHIQQFIYFQF
ncbi:MAG: MBOAT family protein [Candidatus Eisenbacteria bacterium]|uniref:MBOAT family protein n=1 Tax=Eiseniibacteriota bacterium TaxID=2212470 RepID=A0A956LWX8_UNCEI|nr:MBOAT family protein [Candidatus Eisenbacteria bacterium]